MRIYSICEKCQRVINLDYRDMFMRNGKGREICDQCNIKMMRVERDEVPILGALFQHGYRVEDITVGQNEIDFSSPTYVEESDVMHIRFGYVKYDTYYKLPYFTIKESHPDQSQCDIFVRIAESVNAMETCRYTLSDFIDDLIDEWTVEVEYRVIYDLDNPVKILAIAPLLSIYDEDYDDTEWSPEYWKDEARIKTWLYRAFNEMLEPNQKIRDMVNLKSIPKYKRLAQRFDPKTVSKPDTKPFKLMPYPEALQKISQEERKSMTIGDMKEIIKDLPNDVEIEINSVWDNGSGELTPSKCDGFYHEVNKKVYLTPDTISL